MAINSKNISKSLKASDLIVVQYTEDGKMAQVFTRTFLVEVPIVLYKKDLASATGISLPNDKSKAMRRIGKKGAYEEVPRVDTKRMELAYLHDAKKTRLLLETKVGSIVRLYQVDNGENVWLNEEYTDFADGLIFGGNRSTPIVIHDNGSRVIICPVNVIDEELSGLLNVVAPKAEPKFEAKTEEEVEEEPLTAPTEEAEDELDEIPEETEEVEEEQTEEVTDEVDELDDISDLTSVKAVEGEEPPTEIDGWTVPEEVFVITKPNGTMWVYGNTKPVKDKLKELHFHYARKWEGAKKAGYPKSGWYRRPEAVAVCAD